jgi:DMSO reductase family type II enzyme heme b subunit
MTRYCLINKLAMVGVALSVATSPLLQAQQATTVADPTVEDIDAGETIPASRIPDNIYLRDANSPDDIIWNRIPAYRTFVTAAPPVHPSTALRFDPKQGQHLYFQVARTAERFYVRMLWHDDSQNQNTRNTVDEFVDAAAIQFALNGDDTNYMMGSGPEKPVNIWYWRADREAVQNLAAGGFGSTTTLPQQPVTGKAAFRLLENRDTEWHLVMSRKIDSEGEYHVGLKQGLVPVAFALWQGAEGQRDGNKRVSHNWILVDVAPPPPPPQPPVLTAEQRSRAAKAAEGFKGEAVLPEGKDVPAGGSFY